MRHYLLALSLAAVAAPAFAEDTALKPCGVTCQEEFDAVADDLVTAIDYRAVGPAEATGIVGFGVGVVATYVPVDEDDWNAVTNEDPSALGLVGLQVTKGLPFNIDIGAFYTQMPGTSVEVYGGELRYAILPGSTVSPALALRASYVTTAGIENLEVESTSVDLSISKGFALLTPYAGVGYVAGEADPDAGTFLKKSEVEEMKGFVGARISLGLIEFTPEFAQIGSNSAYSLRLGFSFGL